ncbi:FtsW/RodA/SpoVE family cell cycle protein [Sciscionella sediminilitoris]|uniref:FtsW/RodA/SpoVE family cell cycle protein n=1 Tax=Sciscionella sediminilitoris TaxID=1445613 RepID=UPI00056BE37D|nr:FtsW/RodA/SpoVE family cell cycle protein [Sciscionella sp. SE31]
MSTPSGQSEQSSVGDLAAAPPNKVPTKRGVELMLLVFATVLVTGAFILVQGNQAQELKPEILFYALAYLAMFGIAHVVVRKFAPYADPLILPCVALLNGLGLVMIYRIDLAKAAAAARASSAFSGSAPSQVMFTAIGIILFSVFLYFLRDHRMLSRYGYTLGLVGLALLILPGILPASISGAGGAKVWVRIPGLIGLQPGEFAKIMLFIFFASFLVAKRDLFMNAGRTFLGLELPRLRDLGPLLFALAASVGVLALEKDLGNSLLIFGVVLVLLYIATERFAWVLIGLIPFIAACVVAYKLLTHVQQRVTNWIDPFSNYSGAGGGYQLAQSLFGLGTGGIFGTGLGAGRPELVPEANSDFIVSGIGEELGFIGLAALLLIYLVLTMRGMRSAVAVRDTFGKLLGGALAFSLAWQVFVVVGGATKLIPETGLTTPFMSAGGSSLLANYILVAILLRISDAARRPKSTPSRPGMQNTPISQAHTVMVERSS